MFLLKLSLTTISSRYLSIQTKCVLARCARTLVEKLHLLSMMNRNYNLEVLWLQSTITIMLQTPWTLTMLKVKEAQSIMSQLN